MPMTTFQELNLQAHSRQLNLILRPVYYGTNPGLHSGFGRGVFVSG